MFSLSKGFTHGGSFHADDVFSTAFLKLLNPNIEILRGFTVPPDFNGIVYDIGNGEFDHHSEPRELREDGRIYASFGKLWRKFSSLLVSDYVANRIEEDLVSILDQSDNSPDFDLLSKVISSFNNTWDSDLSVEEHNNIYFNYVVDLAKTILERYIIKYKSEEKAFKTVKEYYKNNNLNGLIYLEEYMPWGIALKGTNAKVVLYKSNREGYNVEIVPNSGFKFPNDWLGKRYYDKVDGFIFCHAGNFLAVFETKEQAIKAILPLL